MTIDQAQHEIVNEFGCFEDWMERYQYLIDLGRRLPALSEEEKTDDHLLEGCQSRVWMIVEGDATRLNYRAISDAAIVSGLIALLLRVYSGHSAAAILEARPWFIREIGLDEHLSPTRSNGLAAMLGAIRHYAARAVRDATA